MLPNNAPILSRSECSATESVTIMCSSGKSRWQVEELSSSNLRSLKIVLDGSLADKFADFSSSSTLNRMGGSDRPCVLPRSSSHRCAVHHDDSDNDDESLSGIQSFAGDGNDDGDSDEKESSSNDAEDEGILKDSDESALNLKAIENARMPLRRTSGTSTATSSKRLSFGMPSLLDFSIRSDMFDLDSSFTFDDSDGEEEDDTTTARPVVDDEEREGQIPRERRLLSQDSTSTTSKIRGHDTKRRGSKSSDAIATLRTCPEKAVSDSPGALRWRIRFLDARLDDHGSF